MKKLISSILIALAASCAFAKTTTIKPSTAKIQETINWEFKNIDDGMYFILGANSDHSLLIQVNKTLSSGLPADPVTVLCNGTINHVAPTKSIMCYGSEADITSMNVDAQDFKNGSAGTYTFIPLKK